MENSLQLILIITCLTYSLVLSTNTTNTTERLTTVAASKEKATLSNVIEASKPNGDILLKDKLEKSPRKSDDAEVRSGRAKASVIETSRAKSNSYTALTSLSVLIILVAFLMIVVHRRQKLERKAIRYINSVDRVESLSNTALSRSSQTITISAPMAIGTPAYDTAGVYPTTSTDIPMSTIPLSVAQARYLADVDQVEVNVEADIDMAAKSSTHV